MLPKQNVCKLNFFFLFCSLSFFSWKHRVNNGYFFVLFLIIITCFCFCSVNIISWFTWVSLFNNVLFFFYCFLFSSVFNFQWFDMSVYAFFLNDSLNERVGAAHVWVRVWLCDLCECVCMCVSRAISGVGCFALFFFVYYIFLLTFHYALFTVHVSCIWLGKFPVCLHDVLLSLVWWLWWWSWWWLMQA